MATDPYNVPVKQEPNTDDADGGNTNDNDESVVQQSGTVLDDDDDDADMPLATEEKGDDMPSVTPESDFVNTFSGSIGYKGVPGKNSWTERGKNFFATLGCLISGTLAILSHRRVGHEESARIQRIVTTCLTSTNTMTEDVLESMVCFLLVFVFFVFVFCWRGEQIWCTDGHCVQHDC